MERSVVDLGERIYQRAREELEIRHLGKVAAICDAGVAGIGDTIDEALDEALKRYPDKVFYVRKIGPCPAFHMFYHV